MDLDLSTENIIQFIEGFSNHGISTGKKLIPEYNVTNTQKVIGGVRALPTCDDTSTVNDDDFPGPLRFECTLATSNNFKYSKKLSKVFLQTEQPLDVHFTWISTKPDLYLRAVLVFRDSSNRSEPVHRCYAHKAAELPFNAGVNEDRLNHVFSTSNPDSLYLQDSNGMLSTLTPLGPPVLDLEFQMRPFEFEFYCRNSCATGIQRRPTKMVFTLESGDGVVLGRRSLMVQICSCPKRDKDKEEDSLETAKNGKKIKLPKPTKPKIFTPKPPSQSDENSKVHTLDLQIVGEENYRAVLKYAHDLMFVDAMASGNYQHYRPHLDEIERLM